MPSGQIPTKQLSARVEKRLLAPNWKIMNLDMPDKTVEYTYALQNGVTNFILVSRTPHANLHLATNVGETDTNYRTISKGCSLSVDGIKFTNKIVYLKSDRDNTIIEIVEFFD